MKLADPAGVDIVSLFDAMLFWFIIGGIFWWELDRFGMTSLIWYFYLLICYDWRTFQVSKIKVMTTTQESGRGSSQTLSDQKVTELLSTGNPLVKLTWIRVLQQPYGKMIKKHHLLSKSLIPDVNISKPNTYHHGIQASMMLHSKLVQSQ